MEASAMPLLAGTVPVVPALDGLEKALTSRDALRIVLELSQWELRRLWATMVAQAILEEADRDDALDRRDIAWLEGLVSDHNHDEGTIRYCAIDLSWRRIVSGLSLIVNLSTRLTGSGSRRLSSASSPSRTTRPRGPPSRPT